MPNGASCLPYPLPRGCHVVAVTPVATSGETLVTLQMTLPVAVAAQWSETLDVCRRLIGSEKMGALLSAIAAECLSTWMPQAPQKGVESCRERRSTVRKR